MTKILGNTEINWKRFMQFKMKKKFTINFKTVNDIQTKCVDSGRARMGGDPET